jgi:hypothetical protein
MSLIKRGATNKSILTGVFFEAIFFGFLLYLLSQKDVSIVWPLTALGFVIEPGSKDFSQGRNIECSLSGDLSDCVGRSPGYVERKAERQRARRTIAASIDHGLR